MGKIVQTIITVVVAVGASAAIWVAANLWFNQVRDRWTRFTIITSAIGGFLLGVLLHGNRLLRTADAEWDIPLLPTGVDEFVAWVWVPVVAAAVFAGLGAQMVKTHDPRRRVAMSLAAGGAIGVIIGILIQDRYQPALEIGPWAGWTAAGVTVGVGTSLLAHRAVINRSIANGALLGGGLGWFLGTWGASDLGSGSMAEAIVATVVPALAFSGYLGWIADPGLHQRIRIDHRSRAVIFLAPALLFIFATLVVPTVRTIYLSFLDRGSEEFVGIDNYRDTFQERGTWDSSEWTNIFGSRLFYLGIGLLVIAAIAAVAAKRRTGKAVELGGPAAGPLVAGGVLLMFAVFTALRGTIVNNLWWVITVTFASTAIGLAVAVLADGARLEKLAKSIIFMPMAISLVGAAIIWRFMYATREVSEDQTGVLNALWVGLGRLSTGEGLPTIIVGVVLAAVLMALLVPVGRALVRRQYGKMMLPAGAFLLLGWIFLRYIGSGVGGFTTNGDGETIPQTIPFVANEIPFNNVWLMVIMIWIQTGFAMVILSAAIKAIPAELIEAARVDGASRSQIFWRVTMPQIGTTIGVVVTTLMVTVMKVYDIVAVVTNGNFGTQVLANDMFNRAFVNRDAGRGATLAVILFISVLPIMYMNIRRMQRER